MMDLPQDSISQTKILDSKNSLKTKEATIEVIPRKCAEVFQCDRGGLTYICLFCGEDFSKALQLEEHLLEHLVKIVSILDTKSHCTGAEKFVKLKDRSEKDNCPESLEATGQSATTELNQEDFGVFIKTEPSVTEHIIEDDTSIKERWFTECVKCEECKKTFNCLGLKNQHRRQKHNISFPYDCQECMSIFNEEDKFKRHKELHGKLNNPTCKHCKQIFEFQSELSEHLQQTENAATEIQNEHKVKRLKRRYPCHLCGKSFASGNNLKRHFKGDHKGERFYCDICPFQAKDKMNLMRHMRIHTKERPYSCDICGQKFKQSCYVKVHKRKHTGEKPYQCNICGLAKYSNSQLNAHIKEMHLNIPRKIHPCTICDRKCPGAFQLKVHMRTHTGQKPFKCSVCNCSFARKSILREHMRLHESIKAYSCKYCGVQFTQSAGKRRHERRVHEDLCV